MVSIGAGVVTLWVVGVGGTEVWLVVVGAGIGLGVGELETVQELPVATGQELKQSPKDT